MKGALKAGLQAALEILLLLPLLLIVIHWVTPKEQIMYWLMLVWTFCMAGYMLLPVIRLVPFRLQLFLQPSLMLTGSIFFFGFTISGLLCGFAGLLAFNRGIYFREKNWSELITPSAFGFSVAFYFLCLILFFFIPSLKPYLSWIHSFGALTAIISPFAINGLLLREETSYYRSDAKIVPSVKRFNLFVTFLFLSFALVLGFSGITQKIEQWLKELISSWLSGFTNAPPVSAPSTPAAAEESIIYTEPSLIDKIVMALVYIAGMVVTLVLLYYLIRWMFLQLIRFMIWIKSYRGDRPLSDWGYEDDETVLLQWKKKRRRLQLREKKNREKWEDLRTNRERIRYLYKFAVLNAIKYGVDFKASLTPLEWVKRISGQKNALPDKTAQSLASAYNRVRYGGQEPDDETVKHLHDRLKS